MDDQVIFTVGITGDFILWAAIIFLIIIGYLVFVTYFAKSELKKRENLIDFISQVKICLTPDHLHLWQSLIDQYGHLIEERKR